MGLSHTVSEIDGDITSKIAKIFNPRVFYALADGVSLGIRPGARGQKTNNGATRWSKKF